MHNFKELKIWQNAISLAKDVYTLTDHFPPEEKFGLVSQIRRCAISVPSNIAEGSSGSSDKEFKHYLRISLGSSFEMETQLVIGKELEFISQKDLDLTYPKLKELQKMIIGFDNSPGKSKSKDLKSKI